MTDNFGETFSFLSVKSVINKIKGFSLLRNTQVSLQSTNNKLMDFMVDFYIIGSYFWFSFLYLLLLLLKSISANAGKAELGKARNAFNIIGLKKEVIIDMGKVSIS